MASKNPQTFAKRLREQAVKERRDRKNEKRAAARAAKGNEENLSVQLDADQAASEQHDE